MKIHSPFAAFETKKRIGILGFGGVRSSDIIGPTEAFVAANAGNTARKCYELNIVGVTGRTFAAEAGVTFKAQRLLGRIPPPDTLIIPGGPGIQDVRRRITDWFRNHATSIRRVVMVGAGIYPVADTGFLDGRTVTTYWKFSQDLAAHFTKVNVDPTASFIKDGRFYSCGGGTAAIEMALALIEEDYGTGVAMPVARDLVARLRPFGDTERANELSDAQYGPLDRLSDLPAWIAAHLDENLSVEALALKACVCPRHFGRIFRRYFKTTPARYVERSRVDEARRRLRFTRNSVEYIARSVGFAQVDSFRRAFERYHKVSPLRYRKQSQSQSRKRESSHLIAA